MAIIKSTPEAIDAIAVMESIINGGLSGQIQDLNSQGAVLSDPFNWEGPLAQQFRDQWPEMHAAALAMRDQLEALRQHLRQVQADIQMAGGAG